MRLFLLALGLMLIGVWLIIVFNYYFQLGGLKINWLLMFMLVLTFRHSKLLLPFNASMQREGAGSLLTSKIKEMVIIKTSHINACNY